MPFRKQFRRIFPVSQNHVPLIQLRSELFAAIETIAQQEQIPISTVVNNLIRYALTHHQSAEAGLQIWHQLTKREQEITALIWWGLTNPQIARHLSISPNTVKTHIKNILTKFKVHSKESLREMLVALDFSDWIDMGEGGGLPSTNADSPDGVSL